jgi:hypothetical protein
VTSTLFDLCSLSLICSNVCVQPFQPTPAPVPAPLAGWMSNPSTVTHPAVSGGGAIGLGAPSIPGKIIFFVFVLETSSSVSLWRSDLVHSYVFNY